jgi:hypothetical protein
MTISPFDVDGATYESTSRLPFTTLQHRARGGTLTGEGGRVKTPLGPLYKIWWRHKQEERRRSRGAKWRTPTRLTTIRECESNHNLENPWTSHGTRTSGCIEQIKFPIFNSVLTRYHLHSLIPSSECLPPGAQPYPAPKSSGEILDHWPR